MPRARGFTLIEIMISVAILVLILALAVPSLVGVMADKRLKSSLNEFNDMVHLARERSVAERRAYLIVWRDKGAALRPEIYNKDEEVRDAAQFPVTQGESLTLSLPSALRKDPPAEWIFWPSGNCEPAIVSYKGANGSWSANFSPLTAQGELISYAAR